MDEQKETTWLFFFAISLYDKNILHIVFSGCSQILLQWSQPDVNFNNESSYVDNLAGKSFEERCVLHTVVVGGVTNKQSMIPPLGCARF